MAREMKDSGVEWIGKCPNNWKVNSAKYHIVIENGSDPKTEGSIPVYGSGTNSFKTCGEYKEGPAVLIGRKGSIENPRYIENRFWNVDTAFSVKVKKGFVLRFYYYLALSFDYKYYVSQTTLPSMTQTNYENMSIPVPSVEEQEHIASFLDTKCAEIDKAIEATKSSIEEYKKLKQAIITETVTKGLDPDVEMKDSGIEWIGVIPKHWSLMKMKYLVEFVQDKAQEQDSSKQYIALENIESWTGKYIETENTYGTEGALLCNKDDVIFGKLRPYLAKTMLINENSVCSSEFAVMKGNGLIPRFLNYLARSDHFISVVNAGAYGTKMPRANIDQIGNLYFPAPLVSEQEMVSSFLDTKCSEIDSLIKSKEKLIEELTAYRKSLIYEYVTGKKEVPIESA